MHPLIKSRNLNIETLKEFDVFEFNGKDYFFYGNSVKISDTKVGIYFPHYTFSGELLGYSIRRVNEKDGKWFHSYGFSKNTYLYGFTKTLSFIQEERKVYVVEGLFDFLKMYQCGIKNTVCCFGTLFTQAHFFLLYPFINEIVVIPDGDSAGKKLIDSVQKFKNRVIVNSIYLPDGKDPDDFLDESGKDLLLKLGRN